MASQTRSSFLTRNLQLITHNSSNRLTHSARNHLTANMNMDNFIDLERGAPYDDDERNTNAIAAMMVAIFASLGQGNNNCLVNCITTICLTIIFIVVKVVALLVYLANKIG